MNQDLIAFEHFPGDQSLSRRARVKAQKILYYFLTGYWNTGERLHPFEQAAALPNAALAFAIVRETRLDKVTFGEAMREHASKLPFVRVKDHVVRPIAWAGPIEEALRNGNPRSALVRLTHRPGGHHSAARGRVTHPRRPSPCPRRYWVTVSARCGSFQPGRT